MAAASLLLFLAFQAKAIFGGDSGDLVAAAATMGVPHPPGYALYTGFGWILTKIPLQTVAWRVGLLSSVPHAFTIGLVFAIVVMLTGSMWAGLLSGFLLAGNYVFFLYSVTPEVFGLFDFFVISLTTTIFLWIRTHRMMWVYAAAFILGLSLTHQQVILFLVPACAYLLIQDKKFRHMRLSSYTVKLGAWLLAGLLPYLYVVYAGQGSSMINWDRPGDIAGFIRLITRADYGTFVSSNAFGSLFIQRALQVQAYVQFVFLDFTWIGLLLAAIGWWYLWKKARETAYFFLIALVCVGPAFFAYASFPLISRFTLGTYERFLLPSYLFLSILFGVGAYAMLEYAQSFRPQLWKKFGSVILICAYVVFLFFPASQMFVTSWRFYGLPADRTMENLGRDVLSSAPSGSLILLDRDTPLFSALYMRYALHMRPDTIVLHASRLQSKDYFVTIQKNFPGFNLPIFEGEKDPMAAIVRETYGKRPIFATSAFPVGAGYSWVPYGLLYELVRDDTTPRIADVYAQNILLWSSLHNPESGLLSRYPHLMLTDVNDVYGGAHNALGAALLRAGKFDESIKEFTNAITLAGDDTLGQAYQYAGLAYLAKGSCKEALVNFAESRRMALAPSALLFYYEGVTYKNCLHDAVRGDALMAEYEKTKKQTEMPIQ